VSETAGSSYAFAVEREKIPSFARKRARRGTALVALGLAGLVFGVFWVIWGIVLIILTDNQRGTGVGVSIVAAGPTIAGWLAMTAGVRRRAEAELCPSLTVLGESRGEVTLGEVAHLMGFASSDLQSLLRALTRDGVVRPTRPAEAEIPAVLQPFGGPKLREFRRARGRRALFLGIASLALMGFASFWLVVAVAGAMSKAYLPALILFAIAMIPASGGVVLMLRARNHRRRARRVARFVVLVATRGAIDLDALARAMEIQRGEVQETAIEATDLGVVPRELLRDLSSSSGVAPRRALAPIPLDAFVGRTLAGTWRVESLLARGGMGAVFRGRHVANGQPCAVKVLLPDASLDDDALRRFEREATSASKLGHASIVRVLDFGRSDDGAAFLVMELLEGETLEARLQRQGALPASDAIDIVRQIGDALVCAHDAGLLHRDIKPANVFLVRDAARVVLVDFGLVRPLEENVVSRLTTSGVVAGTPLYMSPEQAAGETLDVRSDVYALAVVLFEMLTGTPPFFDRTVAQVYARLLREDAPRVHDALPTCPPALDDVIARALARSPNDRPSTMRDFLRALDEIDLRAPPTALRA
jgi:hypothetical protein